MDGLTHLCLTVEDDTPCMRDLNRYVLHKYVTDWEDIGIELGLENQIDVIKMDNQGSKDRFRATLQKWLKSTTPRPTWKMLEIAITNVKRAQQSLDPVTDIYGKDMYLCVDYLYVLHIRSFWGRDDSLDQQRPDDKTFIIKTLNTRFNKSS